MIVKKISKPSPKISRMISGLAYVILNVTMAVAVIALVNLFDAPWFALLVIAIGKWRIFSVKIRFWWANLKSNFTDIIVGISYVLLINYIGVEQLWYQVAVAVLYLVWLLFIKPSSSTTGIMTQGLVAIFVSNLMLSMYGYDWSLLIFLPIEMFIGYNIMGHYLANSDFEIKYTRLMSGIWGVIMMELAWIYWHWLIGYNLVAGMRISQFAIISTALTFVAYKTLFYMNQDSELNRRNLRIDLIGSTVFVVLLILVMLLFFSKPLINV